MFTLSQTLFSSPHHSTSEWAGRHKKLREDTARTADPTGQRDIPYDRMPHPVDKLGEAGWEEPITAWELAGQQSAGGKQWHGAALVSISAHGFHFFFNNTLPHPTGAGV